jgi:cytoskeleton protein RodZ
MASAGFGEHLKREREMRGVSLDEIAGATRISRRFLEALEKEAWDRLPGGVFNRGFVRTVARFLGLEEETLLAEYSLAKGEVNPPPPVSAELPAQQPSAGGRNVSWLTLAAIAVVLAVAAGGWFGWQWIAARQAELNAAASSLPASPLPPTAPQSALQAAQDFPATTVEAPQASVSPWSESTSALQLNIQATRDTAITVTADGRPIFSGAISIGERRSFSANRSLTVEAQDAGAIRLDLNGEVLAPIGPSGLPGRVTLGHPSDPSGAGGHD